MFGEPDEGEPHVRFCGGTLETGPTEVATEMSTDGKPSRVTRGHPSSASYRASVLPGSWISPLRRVHRSGRAGACPPPRGLVLTSPGGQAPPLPDYRTKRPCPQQVTQIGRAHV